ncbi:MAG: protein-L-isoaspartate O-methyltransferase [Burkholderiales bacterium]|nr:protein-L-isoaspartate O-methyltransferase [Burkholderiales bacterium]MCH2241880.1 protein-L-isoaspartate O-methyltransferase [Aquabacterium sp.]
MNIEQARFNMIEQQIRTWNVLDTTLLELLAVVKREDFVPPAYRSMAFMDLEIPLPGGQSMFSPKLEARLVQDLDVHKHETVLEVGTGSGYMAALLAHKAQRVITLEIRPELAQFARDNIRRAGIANVEVVQADGSQGHAAQGPYDAILLSGSVAQVPQELLAQLKPGGRLVAIVGNEPVMTAVRITQDGGRLATQPLFDTIAPRLVGFAEAPRFHF